MKYKGITTFCFLAENKNRIYNLQINLQEERLLRKQNTVKRLIRALQKSLNTQANPKDAFLDEFISGFYYRFKFCTGLLPHRILQRVQDGVFYHSPASARAYQ